MSFSVNELYQALVEAGVSEDKAQEAARAVFSQEEAERVLASKADLRVGLVDVKTEVIKGNTGTLLAATGMFAVIVKLMG